MPRATFDDAYFPLINNPLMKLSHLFWLLIATGFVVTGCASQTTTTRDSHRDIKAADSPAGAPVLHTVGSHG